MTIGQVTPNKLPIASGSGLAAAAEVAIPPAPAPAPACPAVGGHDSIAASLGAALQSLEVADAAVDLESVECPEVLDEANRGGRPSSDSSKSTEVG